MPSTCAPRREVLSSRTRRPFEAGSRWRRLAPLACCALALGACEKSPAAPATTGGFDPAAVSAAVAVMHGVLGTPTMQSLAALSPLLKVAAAPPIATAPAAGIACAPPAARTTPAAGPLAPQASSLIADSLFRRVFVWDTAANAYRAGADTSGPAGGIRFVLYGVTSYALPVVPLTSDGWLDLTDQSTAAALQLRAQVSSGSSGLADYVVGLSGTQTADTAQLSGTVTDGTRTLAFRDSTTRAGVTGTAAYQVTVTAHLSDTLAGFTADMFAARTNFDPFDYNDTLDVTFTGATETVRLAGSIITYCLQPSIGLRVSVNDSAFATITNGATTPNVTLSGGQSATAAEAQALLGMKDAQQQLFAWLGDLFAPARALLP